MELVKLNPDLHNLYKVSTLIYETDPSYFRIIFGSNKDKTIKKIKRLVENSKNRFGYEFVKIAINKDDVYGLIIGYDYEDFKKIKKNEKNIKNLTIYSPLDLLRLFFLRKRFLQKVLVEQPSPDDFYVNNISVKANCRRRGIGSFIIKRTIDELSQKKIKRVFLNVSTNNNDAVNFFKKNNFKIYEKKSTIFKSKKIEVSYMQYLLKSF